MIDADRIRDATEQVLRRPAYQDIPGTPWSRLWEEIRAWFATWIDDVLATSTAGRIGQAIALLVVVVVVVLAVMALLGMRRRANVEVVVDITASTDRHALALEADRLLAAGELEAAIRARYASLVVLLVDADILLGRPGITVGEVNEVVAASLPTTAPVVAVAGRALAEVVYGHRSPTAADDCAVANAVAALEGRLADRLALRGVPA